MKPLVIRFQAFGPYKNEEVVDFGELSRQGLFLICGETGSGKTTILDAMTFALFGKSSGGMRDQLEAMRCKQSEWGTDTFVCYDFELQGNTYRFERRLECKKVKLSASQNVYKQNAEGVFEPLFENCKEKDMNAKAKELLGLDYDQFRQVIILPQGQFEKLLTSNSDEKEKILVSIFGVNKWQKIANAFYEIASEKRNELLRIKEETQLRLQDENCDTVEEFEKQIQILLEEWEKGQTAYEQMDFEGQRQKLEKELELGRQFQVLFELQEKLAALAGKKTMYEEQNQVLKRAEQAESLRAQMTSLEEANQNYKRRAANKSTLKERLPVLQENLKKAEEAAVLYLQNKEKVELWQAEMIRLEERKPYYESLSEKQKEMGVREREYLEVQKANEKAKGAVRIALGKVESVSEEYKKVRETYTAVSDAFLAGITGNLASQLEEGMPCPVCGSTSHPQKALLPEVVVSEAEVKQREMQMHQKFSEIQKYQAEYQQALLVQSEQEQKVLQCQNAFALAQNELENAKKNLFKGITSMQELLHAIEIRRKNVRQFQEKLDKLNQEAQQRKQEFSDGQTKLEIAMRENEEAKHNWENAEKLWISALEKTSFVDYSQAKGALLSNQKMQELRESFANYQARLKHLTSEVETKQKELQEQKQPDVKACEEKLTFLDKEKERLISELASRKLTVTQKQGKLKRLQEISSQYEVAWAQADTDWALAKNLRGDTGIGLQRYVLGVMFSSVIAAANQMLEKVHGGRYRLFRSDEKGQGSNKKGLELKVFDSYSKEEDEGRSVKTLSGGEKFLVSLALSIGMSTIAQRSGTHLDAMFVDEGFGSLDQNSIEDALEVLASIQKANGTVGIISHVQVLQDNIPTKLEIQKTKAGSHIVMNIG